jgi:hypothetical protein
MSKRRRRNVTELTAEAAAIIDARAKATGRTRKDLVSTLIVRAQMWGDSTLAIVFDAIPPTLARSEAFWSHARGELLEGLERCREKKTGG